MLPLGLMNGNAVFRSRLVAMFSRKSRLGRLASDYPLGSASTATHCASVSSTVHATFPRHRRDVTQHRRLSLGRVSPAFGHDALRHRTSVKRVSGADGRLEFRRGERSRVVSQRSGSESREQEPRCALPADLVVEARLTTSQSGSVFVVRLVCALFPSFFSPPPFSFVVFVHISSVYSFSMRPGACPALPGTRRASGRRSIDAGLTQMSRAHRSNFRAIHSSTESQAHFAILTLNVFKLIQDSISKRRIDKKLYGTFPEPHRINQGARTAQESHI